MKIAGWKIQFTDEKAAVFLQCKWTKGVSTGNHGAEHNFGWWLRYLPHHRQETQTAQRSYRRKHLHTSLASNRRLLCKAGWGTPGKAGGSTGRCRVCSPCPGRSQLLAILRRGHHLDPLSSLLATRSWRDRSWPLEQGLDGAQHQPHCLPHALPRHPFPSPCGSSFIECDLSFGSGMEL